MGNWGTGIEENDTYMDVEAEFLEQLDNGVSKKELLNYFIEEEDFDDVTEETHDWWFAIAGLFWKIGYLDKKVFQVVKKIIETNADVEYWKECDADTEDLKEREIALNAFLKKITLANEKPF